MANGLAVGDYVAVCPHMSLEGGRIPITVLPQRYNMEPPGGEAQPLVGVVECEHCEAVRHHMEPEEWPAYIQGVRFGLMRFEGSAGD